MTLWYMLLYSKRFSPLRICSTNLGFIDNNIVVIIGTLLQYEYILTQTIGVRKVENRIKTSYIGSKYLDI